MTNPRWSRKGWVRTEAGSYVHPDWGRVDRVGPFWADDGGECKPTMAASMAAAERYGKSQRRKAREAKVA